MRVLSQCFPRVWRTSHSLRFLGSSKHKPPVFGEFYVCCAQKYPSAFGKCIQQSCYSKDSSWAGEADQGFSTQDEHAVQAVRDADAYAFFSAIRINDGTIFSGTGLSSTSGKFLSSTEEEIHVRTVTSAPEQASSIQRELSNVLLASDHNINQAWDLLRQLVMFVSRRIPVSHEMENVISRVLATIVTQWHQGILPAGIPGPYRAVAFLYFHRFMTNNLWRECLMLMVKSYADSFYSATRGDKTSDLPPSYLNLSQLLGMWRLFLNEDVRGEEKWLYRNRSGDPVVLWTNLPRAFAAQVPGPAPKNHFIERLFLLLPAHRNKRQISQEIGDCFVTTLAILCGEVHLRDISLENQRLKVVLNDVFKSFLSVEVRSFLTFSTLIATGSLPKFPLRRTDLASIKLSTDVTNQVVQSLTDFCSRASAILPNMLVDVYVPRIHDEILPVQDFLARNPHSPEVRSFFAKTYHEENIQTRLETSAPVQQVEWAIRETSRVTSEALGKRAQRLFEYFVRFSLYHEAMMVWRSFRHILRHELGFLRSVLIFSRRTANVRLHERLWAEMQSFLLSHLFPQYIERLNFLVRQGEVGKAAQIFILLLRRAENAQDFLITTGWISNEQKSDLDLMQNRPLSRDFIKMLVTEGEDHAAFELFSLLRSSDRIQFRPDASLVYLLLDCALKNGRFDTANMMTRELRGFGIRLREEQAAAVFAADMLTWPEDISVPAIKERLTGALKLVHPNAPWPDPNAELRRTMSPPPRLMETLARMYTLFVSQVVGYCDSKSDTTKFILATYDHALTVAGVPYYHTLYQNIRNVFADQLHHTPRLGIMLARDKMPGVSRSRDVGVEYLLSFYLSSGTDNSGEELQRRLRNTGYGRELIRELVHKKPGFRLNEVRIWDMMPMSLGRRHSNENDLEVLEHPEKSQEEFLDNARQLEAAAWENHERGFGAREVVSDPSIKWHPGFEAQLHIDMAEEVRIASGKSMQEDYAGRDALRSSGPEGNRSKQGSSLNHPLDLGSYSPASEHAENGTGNERASSKVRAKALRESKSETLDSVSQGMQALLSVMNAPRKEPALTKARRVAASEHSTQSRATETVGTTSAAVEDRSMKCSMPIKMEETTAAEQHGNQCSDSSRQPPEQHSFDENQSRNSGCDQEVSKVSNIETNVDGGDSGNRATTPRQRQEQEQEQEQEQASTGSWSRKLWRWLDR